jgi:hypothetical protein
VGVEVVVPVPLGVKKISNEYGRQDYIKYSQVWLNRLATSLPIKENLFNPLK